MLEATLLRSYRAAALAFSDNESAVFSWDRGVKVREGVGGFSFFALYVKGGVGGFSNGFATSL